MLYVRFCNRRTAAARQPRVDELAASEVSLAAQLQAMQKTLMGSGRDLSTVAALKVFAHSDVWLQDYNGIFQQQSNVLMQQTN
jgi:hypothetical protein